MYTTAFWIGALDRVVKSFAQSLLVLWGADAGFNVLDVDVASAFGIAAGYAVISLLTSVVSAPVAERGTTSLLSGGR